MSKADLGLDWEQVYRDHHADLRRLIARYVPRPVVDDVLQETFARAYRSRHRFDVSRSLWPWLATIAYRSSTQWWRSRRPDEPARPDPSDGVGLTAFPGSDAHIRQLEMDETVGDAMAALTPRHRRVLYLHAVDGYRCDDLARMERTSPKAVRSTLERAKARFRGKYEGPVAGSAAAVGWRRWVARIRERLDAVRSGGIDRLGLLTASAVSATVVGVLAGVPGLPATDRVTVAGAAMASSGVHVPSPLAATPPGSRTDADAPDTVPADDLGLASSVVVATPHLSVKAEGGVSHSPHESRVTYTVDIDNPVQDGALTLKTEAYCDHGLVWRLECAVLRALPTL